MKRLIAVIVFLAVFLIGAASFAKNSCYGRAGATYGLGVGSDSSGYMSVNATFRLQYPKYTPLALELFLLMPYGAGADVQIAGFVSERFSARLLDVGVFLGSEPTNRWVAHAWSLMLGAGMEYRFSAPRDGMLRFLSLTLDYRVFLPDPGSVLMYYGDFGLGIYTAALRRGQLILGLSVTF